MKLLVALSAVTLFSCAHSRAENHLKPDCGERPWCAGESVCNFDRDRGCAVCVCQGWANSPGYPSNPPDDHPATPH